METTKKTLLTSILILGFMVQLSASNLRTLMTLSGNWQFSLGDNKDWARPQFDDSKWDNIIVPSAWEKQGYIAYDGFAWYRKKFSFPDGTQKQDIFIQINNIDDVDRIYINGQSVGHSGKFPPKYETGYGFERIYLIPEKLLNFFGENTVAIRVYDDGGEGGIVNGPVRLVYNEAEEDLSYKLDGDWKFTIKDKKDFIDPEYNDGDWKNIKVPQAWQTQGYWGYNDHAWYRYTFELDSQIDLSNHYLLLGKIDDYDEVYLNGKMIGSNWPSSIFGDRLSDNGTYRILRGYHIPKNLVKIGKNVIAIRVFDYGGIGGIYEGPIGIVKEKAWKELEEKDVEDRQFYRNFTIFDLFN